MNSQEINLLIQSAISLAELIYKMRQQGQIPEDALRELKKKNSELELLEDLVNWEPEKKGK